MEKRCSHCKNSLTSDNFNKNVRGKFGLSDVCKDCRKLIRQIFYEKNKERLNEQSSKYKKNHPEAVYRWQKKYSIKNRDKVNSLLYKYRKQSPEKYEARQALCIAVRRNKLKRLPCEVCGNINSEGHHYLGYKEENWLDVKWLCSKHHKQAHGYRITEENKGD